MGVVALGDGAQFFHDVRWRRAVGVPHAEIDNILAATACGHLQFGGDVEYVRGRRSMRVKRRCGLLSAIGDSSIDVSARTVRATQASELTEYRT